MKSLAKRFLPDPLYKGGGRIYHRGLNRAEVWKTSLEFWKLRLQHGTPEKVLFFGVAPGDDLLCTAVLKEWEKRGLRDIWMVSNHPGLFQGGGSTVTVLPPGLPFQQLRQYCFLEYARFKPEEDRSVPPARHILAELCKNSGITGEIALRPYLNLDAVERTKFSWIAGKIAIQSSGLGSAYPMRNKQWYPERFQAVVDELAGKLDFVQVGSLSDPPLDRVQDLRGKTTIRETASILANARLYIGNVGFLMHLARSVECPSVIIYGGREAPWQSGYSANMNLYKELPCSPCWLLNSCDYNRKCMDEITPQDVIRAVGSMLNVARGPLAVDTASI